MTATQTPAASPLPKNYRLVFAVFMESGPGSHLTMSDVSERATEKRPRIGHSTVYRGLGRLRDLGLISEILVPGADSATYEPLGPQHARFHYALPAGVLADVALESGFTVESGNVTFAGRCCGCHNS